MQVVSSRVQHFHGMLIGVGRTKSSPPGHIIQSNLVETIGREKRRRPWPAARRLPRLSRKAPPCRSATKSERSAARHCRWFCRHRVTRYSEDHRQEWKGRDPAQVRATVLIARLPWWCDFVRLRGRILLFVNGFNCDEAENWKYLVLRKRSAWWERRLFKFRYLVDFLFIRIKSRQRRKKTNYDKQIFYVTNGKSSRDLN